MSDQQPINYVDYNFDNLVSQLQNNLAATSAWKDVYKSATGQMLIELFAAVGSLVLYYIERRATESYISLAKNYSSVVNLARLLNYNPIRNTSSVGTLRFYLEEVNTKKVYIPQYTISTLSDIQFLVSSDGVIMPGQLYVDVPSIQGKLINVSYTSSGGTTQEYNIVDTQVENSNLNVVINDVVWTKVTSFINSIATSMHYVLRPELDGTITIVFGNGVFGKCPSTGDSVDISYIKSDGLSGNVYDTAVINTLSSTIYDEDGVATNVSVTNTTTFLGGDDAEDIEDVRNNAPNVFSTGDRLVTKSDFMAVIGSYPSVGDVNVWGEAEEANPNYNNFNQVKICAILQNWVLPDESFQSTLSEYLYNKSLMTVRYSYVDSVVLEVIPSLTIVANSGVSLSYLQAQIDTTLASQFVLGSTTNLGTSVYFGDIVALIEGIAGVKRSYVVLKVRKELTSAYDSTYSWSQLMDTVPLLIGGVELYIDDTKIATDNGSGGWTASSSAYTISGLIDYNTGLVGANISPSPITGETVYCRYQQNNSGDILVGLNQICRYIKTEYISIGY